MSQKSNGVKIEFKPSVILMLLSALTLFVLIMLQFSGCFMSKLFYNFFGQVWTVTWIMSLILLLTISTLFFKVKFLKIIFVIIIIIAIITSIVGSLFVSNNPFNDLFNIKISNELEFNWKTTQKMT